MEIDKNGNKIWRTNGKLHRENGPALEFADGSKEWWFINGKLHREDGPAVDYGDGFKCWFIGGEEYSFDKWLDNLQIPEEEKVMLCLIWK